MAAAHRDYGPIYHTVIQFLTEDDWRYYEVEDRPILRMGFEGKNGSWVCYAQARDEQRQFLCYSVMESKVPEPKRQAVAEFLTRANYGLWIGNFEMDFSDGEVRFKTSVDVGGGELTTAMVKTLVHTNVLMMDRYLPGIMSVIYGGTAPAEAVAEVEG